MYVTLIIFLLPPVVGFVLGKVRQRTWRTALLTLFVLGPPIYVITMALTSTEAAPGWISWWFVLMGIIFVPWLIWATGAFAGFWLGKSNVR
jgi:hypothetical protein